MILSLFFKHTNLLMICHRLVLFIIYNYFMDTERTFHVHRQKLITNIHFEMIVTSDEIILKRVKDQKTLKFLIELEMKIDWKLKSNEIVAVGLVTDEHHWYYG